MTPVKVRKNEHHEAVAKISTIKPLKTQIKAINLKTKGKCSANKS